MRAKVQICTVIERWGQEIFCWYRHPCFSLNNGSFARTDPVFLSQDVLLNFDDMEYYRRKNIDIYQKEDLFRRFALDNFAAVHTLIKKNKPVTESVKILYSETVREIETQIFEDRIETLKEDHIKPNFF